MNELWFVALQVSHSLGWSLVKRSCSEVIPSAVSLNLWLQETSLVRALIQTEFILKQSTVCMWQLSASSVTVELCFDSREHGYIITGKILPTLPIFFFFFCLFGAQLLSWPVSQIDSHLKKRPRNSTDSWRVNIIVSLFWIHHNSKSLGLFQCEGADFWTHIHTNTHVCISSKFFDNIYLFEYSTFTKYETLI